MSIQSFEFCMKKKNAIFRPSKGSERTQRSPSPAGAAPRGRMKSKTQSRGLRKTTAGGSVDTYERSSRDVLDIINDEKDVNEEDDEGALVEVADEGLDQSDEDCCSVSSVASGPSLRLFFSPQKAARTSCLCSACKTLYQKAKRMKAPLRNKLLDNDPKSLTCDQWVLRKKWRPRRLQQANGKLLMRLDVVKERLRAARGAERRPAAACCSRQHAFLTRSLRQRVSVAGKKGRKKKRRRRESSEGALVKKQQRIHGNGQTHGTNRSEPDPTGPGLESGSESADTNLTVDSASTVAMETTGTTTAPPKKKTGGFRDLLAQLRGNSSMIVKENRS
ncbi:uncharacterized protein si:ch211-227n13.3 isoform X2 [Centropristis striata]|uniref:uncharacterized protein si:ch211-227n13.3 isoform X2 n=1 Tax=Centropristis striata TaxID=184440 RepID=UPI0027DF570B|nr:uncharacterized protein si:ch211-227n13.3 isoform X2 [Centropristis striata]